jgi:hypothetical protein
MVLCSVLLSVAILGAGSASARVAHELEGTFPLSGVSLPAADNSADAFKGSLYIGEFSFATRESRVYRAGPDGTPSGFEFDGAETPAGSFGFANLGTFHLSAGPQVDGSNGGNTGNIYVPDIANGVVDLFDSTGKYICQITGGSAPSASECAGATGSKTPAEAIDPLAVAVDPVSGDLAVGDGSGVVYEFNEAGEYKRELADAALIEPGSLAFDSTGRLYVVNSRLLGGPGDAVRFSAAGVSEGVVAEARTSVAVDLNNDHTYFRSNEGPIEEFDANGELVSGFGAGGVPIAVSKETGQVYATSASGEGEIWSKDLFVANVTTGPATAAGETTATVSGHVDPEIPEGGTAVESCQFEYGENESYGQVAPCVPATPYSGPTDVTAELSGLDPATTYHYRLTARDTEGTGRGEDATFVTSGPPSVSGERAVARTRSATVKADIDPFGNETTCEVQYVEQSTFEASEYASAAVAPCTQRLTGTGSQTAIAMLSGLDIGTAYHFRFVAHNTAGSFAGPGAVFSTFAIDSFAVETLDKNGSPYLLAGGHPYAMRVRIGFATTEAEGTPGGPGSPANLRTVEVRLPPGLVGNPTAIPPCAASEMTQLECAPAAQVGEAAVIFPDGGSTAGPVFNLDPPVGEAAQLGSRFNAFGTVRVNAGIRTGGDYGVSAETISITSDGPVASFEMTLWGVPAEEAHDPERLCRNSPSAGCPSGAELLPFLTNPTACPGPLTSVIKADTWQDPGNFVSRSAAMEGMVDCEDLDFKPTISVQPEAGQSESPAGLNVDLHLPQSQNPVGRAEAHLKDATVSLPDGLAINPSGATGLVGCSPEQIELHGPNAASCPDAAKVGSVEVDTPLLAHALPGAVYVAAPHNNPFGSLLAIYIAVNDPLSGVVVKLAGEVKADPRTGRLTTTFRENPQVPFEDFKLNFFSGPQAALMTPPTCGKYETTTEMRPWSENGDAHPFDRFEIASGPEGSRCANTPGEAPNAPSFSAGTITPLAGTYSPFVLSLSRKDGSQRFAAVDTKLPPGLVGKLAGIPYCPEAALLAAAGRSGNDELRSPSCPAASQVGSVDIAVGAGSQPYHASGKAYLTGPYKGGPLGLAIVTPAVAGPFDLGTVVVRVALSVDPVTARITAKSDSLPTILQGIPLDVRSIALRMDRPRFTLNPTSCKPKSVTGMAFSVLGQAAPLFSHFQVGGCGDLGFKPKLALRLPGGTKRGGHPRLRATLTMPRTRQANIARTTVALPHSEFLDQAHINTVCTRVQYAAHACPPGSIYGHARAWSPLLDAPLKGPVYLRSSSHELPDLVASLDGQIHVDLSGRIDSIRGGIRTTFAGVPDAPVSKFVLAMQGGKKGLIVNSTNLCARKQRAQVKFTAHNDEQSELRPVLKADCGKRHGR